MNGARDKVRTPRDSPAHLVRIAVRRHHHTPDVLNWHVEGTGPGEIFDHAEFCRAYARGLRVVREAEANQIDQIR